MGKAIVFVVLLLGGPWCDATPVWARGGTSIVAPPREIVGTIQVVDQTQGRIVMEERGLEVWVTDRSQLKGLVPGQKVRLRYQQQDGRQVINSISPVVEPPTK
jgi:hypothetical protein